MSQRLGLVFALLLIAAYTPPAAASHVTFAVIGDMGTGRGPQFAVARQMVSQRDAYPFDFVITVGDNIYPNGHPRLFKSRFEEPYRELLEAGVMFYASLGNHDVRMGRQAQTAYSKFNMGGKPYYSFVKGVGAAGDGAALVEFFALDTTRMTSAQLDWLDRKLKSSKARWKVVYMHHPLYSSSRRHGSSLRLRRILEPLLVRHGVDLVFAGHDHAYERIRPKHGVQHFVAGAGGKLRRGGLNPASPITAAGNDRVNSFLIARVGEYEASVKAIGADGTRLDELTIQKTGKPDRRTAESGPRPAPPH